MAANDYHLITHWRVQATLENVYRVLSNPPEYPRWWPDAFLELQEAFPSDKPQGGRIARFHVKGYLPYTLWFEARVTESRYPYGFTTEVSGDFNGRGIWTFEQEGDCVFTTFDWRVRVTKPLIRSCSFLLKPLFASNHYWVMRRGEQRLRELLCLEAQTKRKQVAPAPDIFLAPAAGRLRSAPCCG